MEISIIEQLISILYAFVYGCAVFFAYELYDIVAFILTPVYFKEDINLCFKGEKGRKYIEAEERRSALTRKIRVILRFIFDTLFFILLIIPSAVLLYLINYGIVRWYLILSCLCGYIMLNTIFGKTIFRIKLRLSLTLSYYISKQRKRIKFKIPKKNPKEVSVNRKELIKFP